MARLREGLAALGETEFRKLFLGQAISLVGVMFTVVALPFAVLEIGGSVTEIGIVEAACVIPLTIFLLFAVEGPIQVLGPIVARDVYDGAHTWGLTSAAMGVGQIAGGLLSLRWRPRRPLFVIGAGIGLAAFPVAFLALEVPVGMLYASLAAMGVVWGLYDPSWTTCMQREVAPEMISRVASYDYLGSLAFYPAGPADQAVGPLES